MILTSPGMKKFEMTLHNPWTHNWRSSWPAHGPCRHSPQSGPDNSKGPLSRHLSNLPTNSPPLKSTGRQGKGIDLRMATPLSFFSLKQHYMPTSILAGSFGDTRTVLAARIITTLNLLS